MAVLCRRVQVGRSERRVAQDPERLQLVVPAAQVDLSYRDLARRGRVNRRTRCTASDVDPL